MKQLTKTRIKSTLLSGLSFGIVLPAALLFTLLAYIFAGFFTGGNIPEENEWLEFIPYELALLTCTACTMEFVKRRNNTRLRDFVHFKKIDWTLVIMLLLIGYSGGEVLDHFGGLILSNFMTIEPNPDIPVIITRVLSAVVCAPIFEELIFRFGGCELCKGAYSVPVICIANALFFSVVHGYNIQGFANVAFFGMTAAYVYCKTGNILCTIIPHSLHNLICLLPIEELSLFGVPVYYEKNGFILGGWWWVAVNLIITAVCVVYYFKVFRKKYVGDKFAVNHETGRPDTAAEKTPSASNECNTVTA